MKMSRADLMMLEVEIASAEAVTECLKKNRAEIARYHAHKQLILSRIAADARVPREAMGYVQQLQSQSCASSTKNDALDQLARYVPNLVDDYDNAFMVMVIAEEGDPETADLYLDILSEICTKNEAGQHFTDIYEVDDLAALETAGLIEITRPAHKPSGIVCEQKYWHVEVTERGMEKLEERSEQIAAMRAARAAREQTGEV